MLRSWEAEFPDLGVAKSAGSPRVYRRQDVEQVLRIKHLLLVEGLTLAGARRRLGEESLSPAGDESSIDELMGRNARERLTAVKRGLRSILDLLSGQAGAAEFRLAPPPLTTSNRRPQASHGKPARGRATSPRAAASPRRKRSA